MKISSEHFAILEAAVTTSSLDPKKYEEAGLSKKRYRWDTLWDATMGRTKVALPERFVMNTLYEYMNDDHIDTALRKIYGDKR